MKYSEEIFVFKSHIDSAMKDQIPWNILVNLMNELCSTFKKSKEVNHVLLDELKTFKLGSLEVPNEVTEADVKVEVQNMDEDLDNTKDEDPSLQNMKEELCNEENILKEENFDIDDNDFDNDVDEEESDKSSIKKTKSNFTSPKEQCHYCKKMISSINIKTHIRNLHEERQKLPCEKCGKIFGNSVLLKKHLGRCGNNDKPYQCDQCEKRFKQEGSLKEHVKIVHEGIKDAFSCDQCGKTFGRYASLDQHIKGVHEKKKDFKCHLCPGAFLIKQMLEKHIRAVHENVREF